ncbi:MAG: LPS export ABC transporter permease LptG [Syntrophobacteraceae bacterium]|jgi:lipopolysaccharide export system permease protein|nr:LPS export ABC transporter permease LptG [Syntrophobacteraceae bacterium]
MKIISRYVLAHFLPIFALCLCAFVGLYLVIDFFENVDRMIEHHVSPLKIAAFFLYKIPFIATQGIPMAVLLATMISLGLLKRNRELIALETAGIHTFSYVAPIVLTALVVSVIHFLGAETVSRSLNHKSRQIWEQEVLGRKSPASWSRENFWYYGQNVIYQVRLYDPASQTLEKVSLFYIDPEFRLVERLDARRFIWEGGRWTAQDGLILRFSGSETNQEWFDHRTIDLREKPADFSGLETVPEELNWLDLYHYTTKIRQEGFNSTQHQVELHLRVVQPLTTFILAILGIMIALRQGIHGGIAVGVGVGMIVASLYFAVLQLGCALATAEILSPALGVWAGDVIFSSLAGYLWITHHQ